MYSPYIVIPIVSWLSAQLIKFATHAIKGNIDFKRLYVSGGMPSAHTALITSLIVTIGILDGTNNAIFGLAFVIGSIVIYDALGVRRSTGEQALFLVEVGKALDLDKNKYLKLQHAKGHTPLEVVGGAVLGTLLALIFTFAVWSKNISFIVEPLSISEIKIISLALSVIGILIIVINTLLRNKTYRKLPTANKLARIFRYSLLIPSLIGLIIIWLARESVDVVQWRLWTWLLLAAMFFVQILFLVKLYIFIPQRLAEEEGHFTNNSSQTRKRASGRKKSKSKKRKKKK